MWPSFSYTENPLNHLWFKVQPGWSTPEETQDVWQRGKHGRGESWKQGKETSDLKKDWTMGVQWAGGTRKSALPKDFPFSHYLITTPQGPSFPTFPLAKPWACVAHLPFTRLLELAWEASPDLGPGNPTSCMEPPQLCATHPAPLWEPGLRRQWDERNKKYLQSHK